MLFTEAIGALFSLNFGFFVDIIAGNLIWVFGFYALLHFMTQGKHTLFYFLLFGPYLWLFIDFNEMTGLAWHGAIGLLLWLMLRVLTMALAEGSPWVRKNFMAIWVVLAFGNILFNTFIREW